MLIAEVKTETATFPNSLAKVEDSLVSDLEAVLCLTSVAESLVAMGTESIPVVCSEPGSAVLSVSTFSISEVLH